MKSREPAYSQALIQNKIDRQRVISRESDGYGGWCLEFGVETVMEAERRGWIRTGFVEEPCFQFGVKELWRDSKS